MVELVLLYTCNRCRKEGRSTGYVSIDRGLFGEDERKLPKGWKRVSENIHFCPDCAASYEEWFGKLGRVEE